MFFMMPIDIFLEILRRSDRYIETIYSTGACYQLFIMLKRMYPHCYPWTDGKHVITKNFGKFYDITGEVSPEGYHMMTDQEEQEAIQWSFSGEHLLEISCPYCGQELYVTSDKDVLK